MSQQVEKYHGGGEIIYKQESNRILTLKSTITDIKHSLEGLNSKFEQVRERIGELRNVSRLSILGKRQKKMKKNIQIARPMRHCQAY